MDYQEFFDPPKKSSKVNLVERVLKTIEIRQGESRSWTTAWREAYKELGGIKPEVGKKSCPMKGARTLYEYGRIKNTKIKFAKDLRICDVWNDKNLGGKNGTYAILATNLLREKPDLSNTELWEEIQEAVMDEVGYEAPSKDEGAMEVAYQLWKGGHIVTDP